MVDSHRDEIAKLESLYAMNPEGRVFTHLAEACRKAGHLDRARQILEDGLQKHPDYASAHVVLGRVLADSGEGESAATEFRRVLELDRHNLVALRSLGELATQAGHTDEAIHYWSELEVLDPSDATIQDQLRTLREQAGTVTGPAPADAPAVAGEVAPADEPDTTGAGDSGTDGEAEASAEEDRYDEAALAADASAESIAVETYEPEDTADMEAFAPPADLETTSHAEGPEAEALEPPLIDEIELPEWQSSASGAEDVALPGEARPIDEAAWREIAAGGTEPAAREEAAAEEDVEDTGATETGPVAEAASESGADAAEALEAHHARYAPPAAFDSGPEDTAAEEEEESGEDADDAEPDVEGRWQHPEPVVGDVQAERSRPLDDSGDWIPADRWEWVAASADTPDGSDGSSEAAADVQPEAGDEGGKTEIESEPMAESSYDEETSFAGLVDEDDSTGSLAAAPDYEASFAELTISEAEEADLELEAYDELSVDSDPVEDVPAEPVEAVESFEEGAAAVLDAFAHSPADGIEAGAEVSEAGSPDAGSGDWVEEAEDEGDQVITETLAEIYASQGLHDRAVEVYQRLVERHPEDDRLRARLAELESSTMWSEAGTAEQAREEESEAFIERVEAAWTGGEGAAGVEDSLYSWGEAAPEEEPEGPRAGDYFGGLLAWRPVDAVPSAEAEARESADIASIEPEPSGEWYQEEAGTMDDVSSADAGREGEEDLEMFRSWLKSLKK